MIKEAYCSFEVSKLLKEKGLMYMVMVLLGVILKYIENIRQMVKL